MGLFHIVVFGGITGVLYTPLLSASMTACILFTCSYDSGVKQGS